MKTDNIISWDQRLKDQVLRQWENYQVIRIDLATARAGIRYNVPGEYFYVEKASSKSALATVALNRVTNDRINLEIGSKIITVIQDFYVWNDAQTGAWIDIVVGINFEYYRTQEQGDAEAQTCITLTNAGVGNVQAASNICNRVLIRAHTGNAGTVWINFGAAGAVNTTYELTAGDAISVPCSNTDRIQGWFTNGGDICTIVFEA